MSIGYVPKRPSGLDSEALFFQAVWDKLWGGQARINPGRGARVNLTTRGMQVLPEVEKQAAVAGSSSQIFFAKLTAIGHNRYFIAQKITNSSWDTDGVDINVEKQWKQWKGITSETIDGVVISYTWVDENNRTADDGTNSESQVLVPQYNVGDLIFIGKVSNSASIIEGTYVDLTPRQWARRYIQP